MGVGEEKAQNGIRRGRAKALLLFLLWERGKGGIIGGIGREGAIRKMYLCCVYVTIQGRAQKGEEKVSAPVVRNKRWRVTVGIRKLGSPSGDKNAA